MDKELKILLPVLDDQGSPSMQEELPVDRIAGKRLKLLVSPGLVEGLAAGDEIELDPTVSAGFKLVKPSGNACVWFFFDEPGKNLGSDAEQIRAEVERIGGWLDGGGHTSLVFTIPWNVGFHNIERIFDAAEKRIPGSTWMYGNVSETA